MQETINVVEPAQDLAILTLYEARLGLFITATDEFTDDILEMLIDWSSDEIAFTCNRTFALESVVETIRDIRATQKRLFLSHYPIHEITSIVENGAPLVDGTDFEVDEDTGMISRLNTLAWQEPVTITYSGGYALPKEAPPALKNAAILMIREAYFAAKRGDQSIKLIGHKEQRVSFFDPTKSSGGSNTGTTARRAVADILSGYTRISV